MSVTVIASQVAQGNADAVSTSAMDTTGANLIVISVNYDKTTGSLVLSDTIGGSPSGNVWRLAKHDSDSGYTNALYFCFNPNVGANHVFTNASGAGHSYPTIAVLAVSGAGNGLLANSSNSGSTIASIQPGSVAPTADGVLIVTGLLNNDTSGAPTINSSFTAVADACLLATSFGGGLAYLIQPTAAAVNPTWSYNGTSDQNATTIVAFPIQVPAEPADLDTTFSAGGFQTMTPGTSDQVNALGFQSSGNLIAAGYATIEGTQTFCVARYIKATGLLDTTFGTSGYATDTPGVANDYINAIAIQPDNKILVAGTTAGALAVLGRYNADGSIDSGFATSGFWTAASSVFLEALCIKLLPSGKILIGGFGLDGATNIWTVARFNDDGSIDTGFGTSGIKELTPGDTVGANGRIHGIDIQSSGKIIVAGISDVSFSHVFTIGRLNASDGSVDTSFGTSGWTYDTPNIAGGDDEMQAMVVVDDDTIFVTGFSAYHNETYGWVNEFASGHYTADGALDTSFGTSGWQVATPGSAYGDISYGIAIQQNNKIVVAGWARDADVSDAALGRYASDGATDDLFTGSTWDIRTHDVMPSIGNWYAVAIQSDGRIIVGGWQTVGGGTGFAIARYMGDPISNSQRRTGIMEINIVPGTTSKIIHVFAQDSTTFLPKTGLAYGDVTGYYVKSGGTLTALTLEDIATLGTWDSTGDNYLGFKELSASNAEGGYEVDLPDNILASGGDITIYLKATATFFEPIRIQLTPVSSQLADGVAHGGTPGSSTATLALQRLVCVHNGPDPTVLISNPYGVGGDALLLSSIKDDFSAGGNALYCLGGHGVNVYSAWGPGMTIYGDRQVHSDGNPGNPGLYIIGTGGYPSVWLDVQASSGSDPATGQGIAIVRDIDLIINNADNEGILVISDGDGVKIAASGTGKHDINLAGDGTINGAPAGILADVWAKYPSGLEATGDISLTSFYPAGLTGGIPFFSVPGLWYLWLDTETSNTVISATLNDRGTDYYEQDGAGGSFTGTFTGAGAYTGQSVTLTAPAAGGDLTDLQMLKICARVRDTRWITYGSEIPSGFTVTGANVVYGVSMAWVDAPETVTAITASGKGISAADLAQCPLLTTLDLSGNSIDSNWVNTILAALVANGQTGGTADLSGQTPSAPPSGQGVTDAATLTTRGWTVTTD